MKRFLQGLALGRVFLLAVLFLYSPSEVTILSAQTPTWTAINSGLSSTNLQVRTLAIDPVTPTTLYGGQLFDSLVGAFKTTNAGSSWTAINNGLPGTGQGQGPLVFAIDPVTPTTLYAGLAASVSVFKSTDGGASWIPTGLGSGFVDALAIDPVTRTTLYAGGIGGVLKSTDAGAAGRP